MGLRRVGRRARPGGELTIDGGRVLRGRVRNAGGPRFAGKRITVQEVEPLRRSTPFGEQRSDRKH
jgi:hypothetical protein